MKKKTVAFTFCGLTFALAFAACSDFESTTDGVTPTDASVEHSHALDAQDANDGSDGAVSSPDAASCDQNGAAACDRYITTWCERLVECCTGGGSTCSCAAANCTVQACKAYQVSQGTYDCSTPWFTSKVVCEDVTDACLKDIQALPPSSCADLSNGTWRSAPCDDWYQQFR